MSYKCIFKNVGLVYKINDSNLHMNRFTIKCFASTHSKGFAKSCLNNYIHYHNARFQLGLYENNRFIHTTVFIRCSNSKRVLNPELVKISDKSLQIETVGNSNSEFGVNKAIEDVPPESKKKEVVKKSLWRKVKDELLHYYHGFKLFFLDVKVAVGILNTLTKGHTLTRRERKQLVRTSADMARMLPFLIFIIVPFMEFLLPFYLKFFPFMLPSTFQVESKDKEFVLQKLKGKLEIAKFLQEAIAETAGIKKATKQHGVDLETFSNFLTQVRESGLTADTEDILRFSHLFEDEVTLDTLDPKYLIALCKLLDINTMGPSALLRFQLQMKIRQLKVDDQMITNEGVDKIPVWELQQLCRERGMRSFGVSEARLRYQLSQWLSLHLEKKVPTTLLLLSRVMYLPDTLTPEEQLKQAILVLPKIASNTAILKVAETEERVDNKTKIEVIKEEQIVIKKERIEAAQATKDAAIIPPELHVETPQISVDKAPSIEIKTIDQDKAPIIKIPEIISDLTEKVSDLKPTVREIKELADHGKPEITSQDLTQISSAIIDLEDTKTIFHKEELNVLKENREEMSKKLSVPDVVAPVPEVSEVVAKRLSSKVDKMIVEMEKVVENLDIEKSQTVQDGKDQLKPKEVVVDKVEENIPKPPKPKEEKFIDINEVLLRLQKLKISPEDDNKWKSILATLDEDNDGKIEMDHLVKVIKLLEPGDIKLSSPEISKVLEIIDKETKIAETQKPSPVPK